LKQDATAFTFRKTLLKLNGKNFPSSNIQIRIQNEKFSALFTNGIRFISSSVIEFESPPLEQYNFTSTFRFPIFFSLGISFNEGHEFTEKTFAFIDKYATLYLYQLTPELFPKRNISFSIQGLGFEYAIQCVFKIGSNVIYESNVTLTSPTNLQCELNSNFIPNAGLISIFVVNQFNDSSNGFDSNVYGNFIFI
jgi:hypothetical protein